MLYAYLYHLILFFLYIFLYFSMSPFPKFKTKIWKYPPFKVMTKRSSWRRRVRRQKQRRSMNKWNAMNGYWNHSSFRSEPRSVGSLFSRKMILKTEDASLVRLILYPQKLPLWATRIAFSGYMLISHEQSHWIPSESRAATPNFKPQWAMLNGSPIRASHPCIFTDAVGCLITILFWKV